MSSRVFHAAAMMVLIPALAPAAEPEPLRAAIARLSPGRCSNRAEADRVLAEEILKRIPPLDFPSDRPSGTLGPGAAGASPQGG